MELDPSMLTRMAAQHKKLMEEAALEGAAKLEANLSSTSGSGVKYPSLPHRSSAPGEFPVKQSGALMREIGRAHV